MEDRLRAALLCSAVAGVLAACSLVTSFDGFGPPAGTPDAATGDGEGGDAGDAAAPSDGAIEGVVDAADAGKALFENGDFEQGGTACQPGWSGGEATLQLDPQAHSGRWSCRVCNLPGQSGFFTIHPPTWQDPGTGTYVLDAYTLRVAGGGSLDYTGLSLFVKEPDGGLQTPTPGTWDNAPPSGEWRHLQLVAPIVAGQVTTRFEVTASAQSDACILVDDVTLSVVR